MVVTTVVVPPGWKSSAPWSLKSRNVRSAARSRRASRSSWKLGDWRAMSRMLLESRRMHQIPHEITSSRENLLDAAANIVFVALGAVSSTAAEELVDLAVGGE